MLHYPTRELRGRMGIHAAKKHIGEQVVDAAIAAAFEDPKFVPVTLRESGHITVEVDVLSEFEQIKSSGKGKLIKVKMGRDGLYIKYGFKSALLLPSFPQENKMDKTAFFEAACKAVGIQKDLWMQPSVRMFRFEDPELRGGGARRKGQPDQAGMKRDILHPLLIFNKGS
jgi:uncharacterized protein (TIGR00296 family)